MATKWWQASHERATPALHKIDDCLFLRRGQHGRAAAIRVTGLRDPGLLELRRMLPGVDKRNCVFQRVLARSLVGDSSNQRAHSFPWQALLHAQVPRLRRLEGVEPLQVDGVAKDHLRDLDATPGKRGCG